jgi:AraC-like DNA-binding protein
MDHPAELAIRCFEALSGLRVVVHDLTLTLADRLHPNRAAHQDRTCVLVKRTEGMARCMEFDLRELQATATRWPEGRVHRCHAGLVELALPVFHDKVLQLMLFAGPARLADESLLDHAAPLGPAARLVDRARLPLLTAVRLPLLQEQLRQLGARLRLLVAERPAPAVAESERPRRLVIESFIAVRHAEELRLADLAAELGLGVERCRHAVHEACGRSFSELLRAARIRTACALLRDTDLPVEAIAARCGLPDPSGFNRAFRAATGSSPGRWRRDNRV